MITRRRKDAAGNWRYQRWPSNHPANLPEPPWLLPGDLPPKVQAAIMDAVLSGAFKPLPYDEAEEEMEEEALLLNHRPGVSFLDAHDSKDLDHRDYPGWGTY